VLSGTLAFIVFICTAIQALYAYRDLFRDPYVSQWMVQAYRIVLAPPSERKALRRQYHETRPPLTPGQRRSLNRFRLSLLSWLGLTCVAFVVFVLQLL
jgi:1,2-phenylacetyl-CoA epoxidase PaaB subunit